MHTVTLPRFPWASILMHVNQGSSLLLDQGVCYQAVSQLKPTFGHPYIPASLLIPSLPPTTHEISHIPHTRRSFPLLIQPHFAAATASIAGGLLAYVVSLKVPRRDKNDCIEDGRYSEVERDAAKLGVDGI